MRFFNKDKGEKADKTIIKMVTTYGDSFYAWNGRLYESDIVRACIRPKVKAIGKLTAKHIRIKDGMIEVNPSPRIKFLLSEPNPFMTAQQFQEKVANQFCLNNNAFILIVRNEDDLPIQLYPIPARLAEAIYINDELNIRFTFINGRVMTFPYTDIIHLKGDYYEDDIFGTSPAKALSELMNVVGTIDQGVVNAIKNSSVIKWLLKFTQSMRPEDVKKNVKEFVDNYLSIDTDTFGAAGVDAKADILRIEPKDYVPNAMVTDRFTDRVFQFFNTNKDIVTSSWNEDQWNAYYESEIEPLALQMAGAYTIRIFSRNERSYENSIVFEASNLACASLMTKLQFVQMVDRGAMTPNEWRATMNMAPIEGGDKPIRRLDTQVVNLIEKLINQINDKNYAQIAESIMALVAATEQERRKNDSKD